MTIMIQEGRLHIAFRVNEDNTVELADISVGEKARELPPVHPDPLKRGQFLAVHVTGECATGFHAGKHDAGSVSCQWRYVGHRIESNSLGSLLTLSVQAPNGLAADYCLQTFAGLNVVRAWSTLTNRGGEDIGLEYAASFIYQGLGRHRTSAACDGLEFYIPHNGWSSEAQWQKADAVDLGLSHMATLGYSLPDKGNSRYHYGSADSWSTSEYLPMAIVRDPESGEVFFGQVEHSGAWEIEYGLADNRNLYVCLLGPSDDSAWWKNLRPGESFTTVPAAFGVDEGGVSEAVAQLTRYRRAIRRPNPDDENCYVVFNDYMNCLFGDPTEEKEKMIIDRAAALGCEYYCLDCGWYDAGPWWDRVGEWQESPERFPHGLKALFDYGRSKGLRMGMWLEIEVMGTECDLARQLPDDWFICTHGRRRVENKRYLLDFRNPAVRQYCMDVVDRLVADYGCEYFKIDYNVTTGRGSDLNADSPGDAMLEHYRALYGWIRQVYERHPGLVIENCGSGGQRMDYGMLALHSLQSTSDQTDYVSNAYIAASVASAVTPEQAGMWVYPYRDEREHVIFNMVNGLLLRPYVSGIVWDMSDSSMALMREGIRVYKALRGELKDMVPFFPLGFGRVNDRQLAYGLRGEGKAYLSVFTIGSREAEIPLACLGDVQSVKAIYPVSGDCGIALAEGVLRVTMPGDVCARLLEITMA
ncbi:MAG: alpha-galactosidase [Aristaeellaceae bacterium]